MADKLPAARVKAKFISHDIFTLLKHVEFAVSLAEFAGEVEAEPFEQLDFYRGMRSPKLLEIIEREQMTLHIRVGDDVGGARLAVYESHFAERHSQRKRGEAMPFLAGQKHTDVSVREKKNFAGVVAGIDDVLSALELARLQQRLDGLQFRAGKSLKKQVIGGPRLVTGGAREPGVFEQALL